MNPRVASGLVYVHASVLGAIGISAFWSLLNERFDPHSAKALMARVAAAAAFGGLAGGVGAERVTVLMSQGALFILLALTAAPVWPVPFSSVAECLRGVHERRCKRRNGADGPRSGASHSFESSRSWSGLPRRLPR